MLSQDALLSEIEAFLERTGMSATAFGRSAVGDPNLVSDLRIGRSPTLRLSARVQHFITAAHTEQVVG